MPVNHAEPSRYHRQSLLHEIGAAGQRRLRAARVAVIGCGALGSGIIDALARAGVGTLTIADRDIVEWTNLQRQTLYDERHAREGVPKAIAAAERIAAINGDVVVHPFVEDVSAANVARIVANSDVILDGLDNFETRYLLNDLAVREGLPLVYGGAVGTSGMSMTILPHSRARRGGGGRVRWSDARATPCLRCVFPEAPPPGSSPTCDTVGVLGPMVTIVAAFQAAQAIKLVVGGFGAEAGAVGASGHAMNAMNDMDDMNDMEDMKSAKDMKDMKDAKDANDGPAVADALDRRLVSIALWDNAWRFLDVSAAGPSPACPCCGEGRFEHLDATASSTTTSLCGRTAVQVTPARTGDTALILDLAALAARLAPHGEFAATRHLVRGILAAERADQGAIDLTVFPDGRAIVKGTADTDRARSIYARYVGG